jgi:hypothetical protein
LEHDLFRKPISTFRDHALIAAGVRCCREFIDAPIRRDDIGRLIAALLSHAARKASGAQAKE